MKDSRINITATIAGHKTQHYGVPSYDITENFIEKLKTYDNCEGGISIVHSELPVSCIIMIVKDAH